MIQFVIELEGVTSLKEKRGILKSLKERIIHKFRVSAAEVDLQESLTYGQLGIALVSNSRSFGEGVMNKILTFAENEVSGRIQDVEIYSQDYT